MEDGVIKARKTQSRGQRAWRRSCQHLLYPTPHDPHQPTSITMASRAASSAATRASRAGKLRSVWNCLWRCAMGAATQNGRWRELVGGIGSSCSMLRL